MSISKLNFIKSLKDLSESEFDVQTTKYGRVKVVIRFNGSEAKVTRNDLIDKIESLVSQKLSDEDLLAWDSVKQTMLGLESNKAKRLGRLTHLFVNLFKKNRKKRLEAFENKFPPANAMPEIETPIPASPHRSEKIEAPKKEQKQFFTDRSLEAQAKRIGLTSEEIEILKEKNKLSEVLEQLEKTLESEDAKRFFGTADPYILTKVFYENALQKPKAKTNICGRIFKLRGHVIKLKKTELGSGAAGTVYKISRLHLESFQVAKRAKKVATKNEESQESLRREHEMLSEVYRLAELEGQQELLGGVQHLPDSIKSKIKTDGDISSYFEGNLYQGDLYNHFIESVKVIEPVKILRAFDRAIQLIAFLQKHELIHLDIKPDNFFIEELEQGEYNFRLGDFGGVYRLNELSSLKAERMLLFTTMYVPYDEMPRPRSSLEALNRLSTFELGVCIYETLMKEMPYKSKTRLINRMQFDFLDVRNTSSSDVNFRRLRIPASVIEFIQSLIDPDPQNRPTGDALTSAWERVKEGNPNIFTRA